MYNTEVSSARAEKPIKVLLVEDDPGDVKLVRLLLSESAHLYKVEVSVSVAGAVEHLHDSVFDVVLLDLRLPDSQGTDTVSRIHSECPYTPIVVLTISDNNETGMHAVQIGAQDYLVKGDVTCSLLTRTIRYAIERKRMENERRELDKRAENERRELDRKVQMENRLATIGQLASGIGHEINNPLTGIMGYSQLLMQKDVPEDIKKELEIINNGAQRIADIVRRLLTFARQHKLQRDYVNINNIITATLDLLAYKLELSNIKVIPQLDPDLPSTMADAGQLQQAFLNLIINAEMEMKSAHGEGKLFIKTEAIDSTILIYFRDDGPGIAEENLDKIFDPFFTTRETGQGTGLGLSVCHGIIAEHDGKLYAKNQPGIGSIFTVELPVITEEKEPD